jgi:hypothetical protein
MSKVKAELARFEAEAASRYNVTLDQLVKMVFQIHDLALEGTAVVNRHNEPILTDAGPLLKRDLTNANKALEHIAKLTGHAIEKRDVTNRTPLDDLSEDELIAEEARIQAEIDKLQKADFKVVELHAVECGKNDDPLTVR